MLLAAIVALLSIASGIGLGLGTDARVLRTWSIQQILITFFISSLSVLGAWTLGRGLPPHIQLVLVLIGALPAGSTAPVMVALAKGMDDVAARVIALALVSGLIAAPIGLSLFGYKATWNIVFILMGATLLQVAPVIIGLVLRIRSWRHRIRAKSILSWVANLLFFAVVVGSIIKNGHLLESIGAPLLFRFGALFFLTALVGAGLGKVMGDVRSGAFSVMTRNLTTALFIQALLPHRDEGTLLLLVFGLVMYIGTLFLLPIARMTHRKREMNDRPTESP